jgi:CHASE2 domain-containing sensor protein
MSRADLHRRLGPVRLSGLACVAAIAFAGGLAAHATDVLEGAERETLGPRFELRGEQPAGDLMVVGIDAASFGRLRRQWPFPRSLHARAIRRLHADGAREIVYDVQFTEPTEPAEDMALYDAIGDAGGAVLATSETNGRGGTNVLGGDANLRRAGARAAASNLTNDSAGAIARFPRAVGGLETIAVATAERVGAAPAAPATFADGGAWIDYRGEPGTIPTVSFADVVEGEFERGTFAGKIVVVGASAPTLRDVHLTPVGGGALMAGAEVQANAIWTAIAGMPLRSAPPVAGLLLIALLALVAPLVGARFSVAAVLVTIPVAAATLAAGAQLAFEAGTIVEVMPPLVALVLGGVGTVAWGQFAERRLRRVVARDNELLEQRVHERTRELRETQLEIAQRLGAAVEWRDAETGLHIERIGRFCERLALAAGMSPADAEALRHASALHDVGKVGIPDSILLKPGKLDPDEWETMKTHTSIGGRMLAGSKSPLVQLGATIALTHHEHWDGAGYPTGLAGTEIPLAGRICAICDVFDALLSPRPYKEPWSIDDAIAEIERLRGLQFDPDLVDAFLPLARDLHREWFVERGEARPPSEPPRGPELVRP